MSAPIVALGIAAIVVFGTMAFAFTEVRGVKMDPEQFIVAGRSMGTVFLWVLMAGEIYTTFSFLGVAGLAYSAGAPALYALCYGACAYAIAYFITPRIWQVAKDHGLLTGPDFFETRFGSKALGVGIALLQFAIVVPYVALQLSGLQIMLSIAGYGAYNATVSVCIGFVVLAFFVYGSGLRGTAWASVVKDVLVLAVVVFAGLAIPMHFFGSPAALFDRIAAVHPEMLSVPLGAAPHGTSWFVSSVMLSAMGFFMGPHNFNGVYSARSAQTLRRNAMLLPFYQVLLTLMIFAGLSACLIVPGLKGTAVDQSFLLVVQHFYPAWLLGIVAATGALAALVPASALILAAAGVVTKNIAGDIFNLATDDAGRMRLTRALVLIVALLALVVWLFAHRTVVEMLLLYYNGAAQLLPGAVATFAWRRASAAAVGAGIVAGLAVALPLAAANIAPLGLNPGAIGVAANVAVLAAVTLLSPRGPRG